jgi:hypothetical protein
MAKYFRITIGTSLQTTFSVKYSTTSNPSTYDHIADIYIPSSGTFSTAASISYNQLTDNGGAIVRTDDDVYKLTIIDQNGYCSSCISEEFGTASSSGGGTSSPPSTSNIYIYNYETGQSSNGYVSSFPIYYQKWSEFNYGTTQGKTHGVKNDSTQDVYIRLMAKTYGGGNFSPDAIAVKVFEMNNPSGNSTNMYIGSYFGSQHIYPSSTISFNSPAYSGNNYWRLGKNGGLIVFGIDAGVYTAVSQINTISYTLAYSTTLPASGTQVEITSYT